MSCGEHVKAAKTEHTPEPWFSQYDDNGFYEIGSESVSLRLAFTYGEGDTDEANARRIVACVNACAGMTNEQIDNVCMISGSLLNRFGEQMAYLGQVEKQRDELLSALRGLVASCDTGERGPDGRQHGTRMPDRCFVQAGHDAIARVKGGAA